jgi:drug/metabolite transporter (DMT)-like permease
LGTVAILCNALIAPLVFHETFRLRDFAGIVFSTVGAVTIVLSANPEEEKVHSEFSAVPLALFSTLFSRLPGV